MEATTATTTMRRAVTPGADEEPGGAVVAPSPGDSPGVGSSAVAVVDGMGVAFAGSMVGAAVMLGGLVGLRLGESLGIAEVDGATVDGAPDGIREGMSDGIPEGVAEGESEGMSVGASVVRVQFSKDPDAKYSKTLPEGTVKSSSHKSKTAPDSTLLQSKAGTDCPTLGPEVQFWRMHEEHVASLTVTEQLMHMASPVTSSVSQSESATVTVSVVPLVYIKLSER